MAEEHEGHGHHGHHEEPRPAADPGIGRPVKSVRYNDGTRISMFAIILKDHGDNEHLDLVYWDGNSWGYQGSSTHREPSDYGTEGGGTTWHEG